MCLPAFLVLHNDKFTCHVVVANDINYLQPLNPTSAHIFAVVRPIPEAAPVTSATLPETSIAYPIA
tara:strand:- start:9521 stop:9718 length:198 start_codon:yes stop_codon:yes gene_type:complete